MKLFLYFTIGALLSFVYRQHMLLTETQEIIERLEESNRKSAESNKRMFDSSIELFNECWKAREACVKPETPL